MNVLLVGTGGFINGTDPKIPAAAAHTWLCDGGHKTLFSGRRRCGRRRRSSHGSAALRAAGPPYMVRAGDPLSSLPPPLNPSRRTRRRSLAAAGGRRGRLEIVQNPKFSSTTGRIFSFRSIFKHRPTFVTLSTYLYFYRY